MAGLALSLGFHVPLRLWEQTKPYEPLDLSPAFAPKPLPGTSLDNLTRRYGSQLPPLLSPTTQPGRLAPPPPLTAPTPGATASATADSDRREDRPAQQQTTPAAPPLPRRTPPAPVEPGAAEITIPPPPPSLEAPQIPLSPLPNLTP